MIGTLIRITAALLLAAILGAGAHAQTFLSYTCADGTPVSAALFEADKRSRIQVDGKSLSLPRRTGISGVRYAKAGVSFVIKGQEARLKRRKGKAILCKLQ